MEKHPKGEVKMQYSLEDVIKFGKHKGEQIEDLIYDEPGYMTWLYEEEVIAFDEEVIRIMEERKII